MKEKQIDQIIRLADIMGIVSAVALFLALFVLLILPVIMETVKL